MRYINLALILIAAGLLVCTFPSSVKADSPNPEFINPRCSLGSVEISCEPQVNGCTQYESNPDFSPLVAVNYGLLNGNTRYCYKLLSPNPFIMIFLIKNILPYLLITLLIELPVFYILGFKSKQNIFSAAYANLISIPIFNVLVAVSNLGLLAILPLEITVILFEAVYLRSRVYDLSSRRIVITTIIANVLSAIIGSLLVFLLQSILLLY